jgi:phospholipid/cholesterol/gamma-HCH transport system substrate-binding protein
VKNAGIDSLVTRLAMTSESLASITSAINAGEGSVGKLIYEDSIYQQISVLITNLDSLIRDVNANPKKYVGFSLFGN